MKLTETGVNILQEGFNTLVCVIGKLPLQLCRGNLFMPCEVFTT